MRNRSALLLALVVPAFAACDRTVPDDQDVSARSIDGQDPAVQPVASIPAPDTLADALRAHLLAADFRENWRLWPELEPFYSGNEPHGLLLTTYANDVLLEPLLTGQTLMPSGAVVVKENYTQDSTLVATTVMYKQAGYDAGHNDWFFVKYGPDWAVERSPAGDPLAGRVPGCQSCHGQQADADYLYSPRPDSVTP